MKGLRTIDILVRQTVAIDLGDLDEMERLERRLQQKKKKKISVLNKHTLALPGNFHKH